MELTPCGKRLRVRVRVDLIEAQDEAVARDFPRWIAENEEPFFAPDTPPGNPHLDQEHDVKRAASGCSGLPENDLIRGSGRRCSEDCMSKPHCVLRRRRQRATPDYRSKNCAADSKLQTDLCTQALPTVSCSHISSVSRRICLLSWREWSSRSDRMADYLPLCPLRLLLKLTM